MAILENFKESVDREIEKLKLEKARKEEELLEVKRSQIRMSDDWADQLSDEFKYLGDYFDIEYKPFPDNLHSFIICPKGDKQILIDIKVGIMKTATNSIVEPVIRTSVITTSAYIGGQSEYFSASHTAEQIGNILKTYLVYNLL